MLVTWRRRSGGSSIACALSLMVAFGVGCDRPQPTESPVTARTPPDCRIDAPRVCRIGCDADPPRKVFDVAPDLSGLDVTALRGSTVDGVDQERKRRSDYSAARSADRLIRRARQPSMCYRILCSIAFRSILEASTRSWAVRGRRFGQTRLLREHILRSLLVPAA